MRMRHLILFSTRGLLRFIAMDFLHPLPKTTGGSQFVLAMNNRNSKLTRAGQTLKTRAANIATIFYDHWIVQYEIFAHLLKDNRSHFVSTFFERICNFLGLKPLTITAFHHLRNGQAERYNRMLISRMRRYVSEHQRNWDIFVEQLTN